LDGEHPFYPYKTMDINVDDIFQYPTTSQEGIISRIEDVVYDPRIKVDDATQTRAVWTTESVHLAEQGIKDGYRLKDTPFLATIRGYNIRKSGVPFRYSEDELVVLNKCMTDKVFYANNFGKLKNAENGWSNITLREYQENLLDRYSKNRWNIIMFPRQSGKTTTTIIEIAHFITFNIDKDCVVIAQSDKVVTEILVKIKEFISKIPYFMQPGCVSSNKNGFVFENGCRLTVGIASESVVQGFSLDLLYVDEFAYIKPSMVNKFWENIYPSLTNNPNSRCIITSTPNGRNKFYEMWQAAINGLSKLIPYRIYWQDIPGRDIAFKNDTIAIVGHVGWLMGFECSFDAQLKSIFRTDTQIYLREIQTDIAKNDKPFSVLNDIEFISKDIINYNFKEDFFLLGIDIAEGLEQDASTIKINKIDWNTETKRLEYYSIGTYENNYISVDDFAHFILDVILMFNTQNIRVVIESNSLGGELFAHIDNLRYNTHPTTELYHVETNKYTYNKYSSIDNTVFAKFLRSNSRDDFDRGIRWNLTNKPVGVKAFSNLISDNILHEYHPKTIEQYLNFGRQKNGTYKANYGHDDLVMAEVDISYFINSNNIYSIDFLKTVESILRERYFDLPDEVIRERERKRHEIKTKFVWRDFTQKYYDTPPISEGERMMLFQ
jgi:hypothetical protein